jgi:hypothetical protein
MEFAAGIGRVWDWKVTSYPPAELKCLSEKRRREIAVLVGGTKAAISLLLSSLTHFNPTGRIPCTLPVPLQSPN